MNSEALGRMYIIFIEFNYSLFLSTHLLKISVNSLFVAAIYQRACVVPRCCRRQTYLIFNHLSMWYSIESSIVLLGFCLSGPFKSHGSLCFVCSIFGNPEIFLLISCHSRIQGFLEAKYNLIRLIVLPLESCYFFGILHKKEKFFSLQPLKTYTLNIYLSSLYFSQLRQKLIYSLFLSNICP